MIGRWLCRQGRHKWIVMPKPLRVDGVPLESSPLVAGVCVRCCQLARWRIPGSASGTDKT